MRLLSSAVIELAALRVWKSCEQLRPPPTRACPWAVRSPSPSMWSPPSSPRSCGGYSTHEWGWRKRFNLGPLTVNLSRRGASVRGKIGRFSTNSRSRRLRASLPFGGWWQSRSLSPADNQPPAVVKREEPRGFLSTALVFPCEQAPSAYRINILHIRLSAVGWPVVAGDLRPVGGRD